MDLTEECFQQTTLKFIGDTQWIQASEPDNMNRTEIPARRTTNGTFPPGSQWTRNPVRTLRPPSWASPPPLFPPELRALSLHFRFRHA